MTRYKTNVDTIGSNLSDTDGSHDATHSLTYEGLQVNQSNLSATNRSRDASYGHSLPANKSYLSASNRSHGTSQGHSFVDTSQGQSFMDLPANKSNLSTSNRIHHTSQGQSFVDLPANKSNLSSSNRSRHASQGHSVVGLPSNKNNLSAANRSGYDGTERYEYVQTAATPNHFLNNFCSISFGDDVSRHHVGQPEAESENKNAQSGPTSDNVRASPSKEEQLDPGPFCCASPSMGSQRYSVGKTMSRSTGVSGTASADFHESHDGATDPDTSDSNVWNEHTSEYMMGSADQSYEQQDEYNRELAPMHARRRCLFATLLLCSIVATLGVALAAFRNYRSMVKFNSRVFTPPKGASSSYPSSIPSSVPSTVPSSVPSTVPSSVPSTSPTVFPSAPPSQTPTVHQSDAPSMTQSSVPSTRPSRGLSNSPIPLPSLSSSTLSSGTPSRAAATSAPSRRPTTLPTPQPSQGLSPSSAPTGQLTLRPTTSPTSSQ